MDKLISIIVPIYNAEKHLNKCLQSILMQTYKNFELLLINDGSTDDSKELCEDYAHQDDRVKLFNQENKGVLSARLRGIEEAKGSFIGWVDADDWIEKEYFENLIQLQMSTGADIIAAAHFHDIGNDHLVVKNSLESGIYCPFKILDQILYTGKFFEYGITPQLYSKLFKADILKHIKAVDDKIIAGDDAAILYPTILEAETICVTELCGYHYIQHPQSITKKTYSNEIDRIDRLISYLSVQFEKKNVLNIMQKQLTAYRNYLLALRQIEVFDHNNHNDVILMPYGGIHKGEKVIVYGAGVLGQQIYKYLKREEKVSVEDWVDKNYELYWTRGFSVNPPEKILDKLSYIDYIIIANITETIAESIKSFLVEMNVPVTKIRWFTKEFRGC